MLVGVQEEGVMFGIGLFVIVVGIGVGESFRDREFVVKEFRFIFN